MERALPDAPMCQQIHGPNRINIVSPPDACEYFRWVAAALKASASFQANLSSNGKITGQTLFGPFFSVSAL
jgi:hypothetical protein